MVIIPKGSQMPTPTIDEVREFLKENRSFFNIPLKNQNEFTNIFRSLNKESIIRDYSQQLKSLLLEQPYEAPKCLLIKMTTDPLSIPVNQIYFLNPRQNGLIFYDNKLYYANSTTKKLQQITAAENQEQKDAQDELIQAFSTMKNNTSHTTDSVNINMRLVEIVSKHNQFASQSFLLLAAWKKGHFELALQNPKIREFLIHNKNHAAIQLWNQQNTLRLNKSTIKDLSNFAKHHDFINTKTQLQRLYSRLNNLFEKKFNETIDDKQFEAHLQLIIDERRDVKKSIDKLRDENHLTRLSELKELAAHYQTMNYSETSNTLKEYAKELTVHCDSLITEQITQKQFQDKSEIIYNNKKELLNRSEKPSYKKINVEIKAIKKQLRQLKTDDYSHAHTTLSEIFQKLLEQQDNFISGKIGELTLNKRTEPIMKKLSDLDQKRCIVEDSEFDSILNELNSTKTMITEMKKSHSPPEEKENHEEENSTNHISPK